MNLVYKNIGVFVVAFSSFTQLSPMERLCHHNQKEAIRMEIIACVQDERFNDLQKIFDEYEQLGDRSEPRDNPYGYLINYLKSGLLNKVGWDNHKAVLEELFNKLSCDQESVLKMALRLVYGDMSYGSSNKRNLDAVECFQFLKNGGVVYRGYPFIQIYSADRFGGTLDRYLYNLLALLQPLLGDAIIGLRIHGCKISTLPDTIGWFKDLKFLHIEQNSFSCIPENIKQCRHLITLSLDLNALSTLPGWITEWKDLTIEVARVKALPLWLAERNDVTIQIAHDVELPLEVFQDRDSYPKIEVSKFQTGGTMIVTMR